MIGSFEKDGVLYDAFEKLSPYDVTLRVKAMTKEFKVISVCEAKEAAILKELERDGVSYLMGRKEDLVAYLIKNSYFDEESGQLRFLISS